MSCYIVVSNKGQPTAVCLSYQCSYLARTPSSKRNSVSIQESLGILSKETPKQSPLPTVCGAHVRCLLPRLRNLGSRRRPAWCVECAVHQLRDNTSCTLDALPRPHVQKRSHKLDLDVTVLMEAGSFVVDLARLLNETQFAGGNRISPGVLSRPTSVDLRKQLLRVLAAQSFPVVHQPPPFQVPSSLG
jgi:hypothetical protein